MISIHVISAGTARHRHWCGEVAHAKERTSKSAPDRFELRVMTLAIAFLFTFSVLVRRRPRNRFALSTLRTTPTKRSLSKDRKPA